MRASAWLPVLLLLAALVPGPAHAQAGMVAIDLVDATDHGCSPDTFTAPDLRVTVRLDGQVVIQDRGDNQDHPLYAHAVVVPVPDHPVPLSIEVEEGEPSGFLGLDTRFVACDDAPGDAAVFTTTWGGEAVTLHADGDGDHAADATVVLGPGAPAAPSVQVAVGTGAAALSWDSLPGAKHDLAWPAPGPPVTTGLGNGTRMDGLCDGEAYTLRVVRHVGDWAVGTDVSFVTANRAPDPPLLRKVAAADGALTAWWEEATPHDVARYALHVGASPDFTPTDANRVVAFGNTHYMGQRETYPWNGTAAYARLVAIDVGGLSAASAAVPIGADLGEVQTPGGKESCGPFAGDPDTPLGADPEPPVPPPAWTPPMPTFPAWTGGGSTLPPAVFAFGLLPFLGAGAALFVGVGVLLGVTLARRR